VAKAGTIVPSEMPSTLGPIPVKIVKRLKDSSGALMGKFRGGAREILLQDGMPQRVTEQVLWHEWLHSVLLDTGVHQSLTEKQAEAVCDSVATSLATHFPMR
jgi:hypothetical protein